MPRQFRITVNGTDYQVVVEELGGSASPAPATLGASTQPIVSAPPPPPPPAPPRIAAPQAAPVTGADVVAQMGGVIAQIFAKPGQTVRQTVNEGFRLMELEAMKMKIPVLATRDGQISHIHVSEGEAVEIGQALVSFL